MKKPKFFDGLVSSGKLAQFGHTFCSISAFLESNHKNKVLWVYDNSCSKIEARFSGGSSFLKLALSSLIPKYDSEKSVFINLSPSIADSPYESGSNLSIIPGKGLILLESARSNYTSDDIPKFLIQKAAKQLDIPVLEKM